MLRNYLKTAFRNLWKNKSFSIINIAGLASGLAVCALILLWVQNEMGYNNFHSDKDRIASVMVNKTAGNNEIFTFPAVPTLLAPTLKKNFPAIEYTSRCTWGDVRLFAINDKTFSETGYYVDPEFLQVFSFPLTNGDAGKVLRQPNTMIISETLAKKYFGNVNPVGKTIMVEQKIPYKVEGVLKDVPANSSIKFDFLMPVSDYVSQYMNGSENWSLNNIRTYVKLAANADMSVANTSIKNFMKRYTDQQNENSLFLWSINDWYLRHDFKEGKYAGGGRITYVKMFVVIAVFILVLACINFMNLSTARATQRAKEVGVRKAIGAGKRSLILQFIGESLMLSLLSATIALLLLHLALPAFNHFLQKDISIDYNLANISAFLLIVFITGVVAGSYPALVLSSFKPVKVLKSAAFKVAGTSTFVRKSLVVTQFTVSIMLVIGTLVVSNQVNYIQQKKLGYNREHLLWFPNNIAPEKNETAISEFKEVKGVTDVTRASMTFTSPNSRGTEVNWPGKKPTDEILFSFITGDHDIIGTMGIKMKEGRGFSKSYSTDTSAFILNEEAVKRMGLKNPIGQTIETVGGAGTIIGVAEDFHFESMHNPIAPVIIECKPSWTWLYYVRIDGKQTAETLKGLEAIYTKMAPGYIFDYSFQDSEYEKLYRSETQVSTLVNWFSFFAIFISCLGLLGLTAYTIERKTKEIGIRKVLGASLGSITKMVYKEFVWPVLLAMIIAAVPAWYFMQEWLQKFTYRIDIGWSVFALAGGLAMAVALLTVSFHAVKAALMNPVKSLRTE